MNHNSEKLVVITPSQVEAWFSGVSQVKIAADNVVSVLYEDRAQISAKLEFVPHALQANFFALVRRVQNASGAGAARASSLRLA